MKIIRTAIFALISALLIQPLNLSATTLTGNMLLPNGTGATGILIFSMSQQASLSASGFGAIATASVHAGSTGYTVGDVVTLGGSGTGGTFTVVTAPGGVVGTVSLLTAGTGYTVASAVPTTGGTGTGLTINVLSLVTCGGPAQIMPTTQIRVTVTGGNMVSPPTLYGNDCMAPQGTYYNVQFIDPNGNQLLVDRWILTGASVNIGTIVSVNVSGTTGSIGFSPFAGLATLSGSQTFTGVNTFNQAPIPNGSVDLGSSTFPWASGWFASQVYAPTLRIYNGLISSPSDFFVFTNPMTHDLQVLDSSDNIVSDWNANTGYNNAHYTVLGSLLPSLAPLCGGSSPCQYSVGTFAQPWFGGYFNGPINTTGLISTTITSGSTPGISAHTNGSVSVNAAIFGSSTGLAAGVLGANTGGGFGGWFVSTGTALFVNSSGTLAAEFSGGNVQIDHLLNFNGTTATTASSVGSITLPASPAGYINVQIGGASAKLPYYAP